MAVADLVGECFASDPLQRRDRGARDLRVAAGPVVGRHRRGAAAQRGDRSGAWRQQRSSSGGTRAPSRARWPTRRGEAGAEIRTGAERLADPRRRRHRRPASRWPTAPSRRRDAVISNADPRRTLLAPRRSDGARAGFLTRIRNYRCPGTVAKVNLALGALPAFQGRDPARSARPPSDRSVASTISSAPSTHRSTARCRPNRTSTSRFLRSPIRRSRRAGRHVMSIYVQFAPYHLRRHGAGAPQRDRLGDVVVNTLERYAPGLVVHHRAPPGDHAARSRAGPTALTGGHIYHGEPALDQFFTMRPVLGWAQYRTPIRGSTSAARARIPGGGITGGPGQNAAREILKGSASDRSHGCAPLAIAGLAAGCIAVAAAQSDVPDASVRIHGAARRGAQQRLETQFLALPYADAHPRRRIVSWPTSRMSPASPRDRELAEWTARSFTEARARGREDRRRTTCCCRGRAEVSVEMTAPTSVAGVDARRSRSRRSLLERAAGEVGHPLSRLLGVRRRHRPGRLRRQRAIPSDYDWLASHGIDIKGKIALVRYSVPYSYRGFKALTAQQRGAAGILIYSDPADDGFGKGKVYPDGPWGPPSHIQRGGIVYDFMVPGDPLTPGWASVPGARRIDRAEAMSLATIISAPLSYKDARVILEALGGPEAPKELEGRSADHVSRRRRTGDGPHARADRTTRSVRSGPSPDASAAATPGRARHRRQSPRCVDLRRRRSVERIRGAHGAGADAGALARDGWRPQRTIVFASWDAEEFTLTSSTEWGEQHEATLRDDAVAYLNVDSAASGPNFAAAAVPSLNRLIAESAQMVRDPRMRIPIPAAARSRRAEERGALPTGSSDELVNNRLGSGSDYTVFLNFLGVPIADLSLRRTVRRLSLDVRQPQLGVPHRRPRFSLSRRARQHLGDRGDASRERRCAADRPLPLCRASAAVHGGRAPAPGPRHVEDRARPRRRAARGRFSYRSARVGRRPVSTAVARQRFWRPTSGRSQPSTARRSGSSGRSCRQTAFPADRGIATSSTHQSSPTRRSCCRASRKPSTPRPGRARHSRRRPFRAPSGGPPRS